MTAEEYRTSHTWVRDEYLKEYPKEDWQKNFVMLSTWNEYGEGTYIMPTSDEKGFGYVDVIRELYTDEKTSASINTVPTAEQLVRINRLYPQYRRLLRKEDYYTVSLNEDTLTEKMSLNLDPNQGNGAIFWVSDNAPTTIRMALSILRTATTHRSLFRLLSRTAYSWRTSARFVF